MKNSKLSYLIVITLFLSLSEAFAARKMASVEGQNCQNLVKAFFPTKEYESKLQAQIASKKLIGRQNKFVTVKQPKLEWINSVRTGLSSRIQIWNTTVYPNFFSINNKEIISNSKTLSKALATNKRLTDDQLKARKAVDLWLKEYQSYDKDIKNILDERISYQYNLTLLKKLKLKDVQNKKLELFFMKDGKRVNNIYDIDDKKRLDQLKVELASHIKSLDGSLFTNGSIRQRVIDQAFYHEALQIYFRELEFMRDNTLKPTNRLKKEIRIVNQLLTNSKFDPSTYGMYRISNKILLSEIAHSSKLDFVYKKYVQTPGLKFKNVISNYLEDRKIKKSTEQKIGLFKRIYARLTSISKTQAMVSGTLVVAGGIGVNQFFLLKEPIYSEVEREKRRKEIENQIKKELEDQLNKEAIADKASADAEQKRIQDEAELKRIQEEAEKRRIKEENEKKLIEEETTKRRIKEEAERRLALEIEEEMKNKVKEESSDDISLIGSEVYQEQESKFQSEYIEDEIEKLIKEHGLL